MDGLCVLRIVIVMEMNCVCLTPLVYVWQVNINAIYDFSYMKLDMLFIVALLWYAKRHFQYFVSRGKSTINGRQ